MARDYVCSYFSYIDLMNGLSDAERGRLFMACLQYGKTREEIELRGNERFVWPVMKMQIDNDMEKHEKKCEKNRESIKKRWDTNVYERIRTYTNVSFGINSPSLPSSPPTPPLSPNSPSIPPKEKPPKGGKKKVPHEAEDFEKFWAAYPRKVGKQAARKAFDKVEVPLDTLLTAIEQQKRGAQWQKDDGLFIPHASTWLNNARWEDEVGPVDTRPTRPKSFHIEMENGEEVVVFDS